jgi:hypothetical protein
MQIPGLNLLHATSSVVVPAESPAQLQAQPALTNTFPTVPPVPSDVPEVYKTISTSLESNQFAPQNELADFGEEGKGPVQTDTVSSTALPPSPDPLDLALADQSSDSSFDQDAERGSASDDRYFHSFPALIVAIRPRARTMNSNT